ncbi:chlorophyll synthesis pathway protein BchC [Fonsecaea pedrosoi CBS 271.37]|uniref:D-xylulose reductase n=1 Tax=Fonsecaea pedrosoi CBS 271.37 TaxID=1442368 RepID=A0A0D2DPT1_9EURO|nr:chlorophyll synthesis pathway protein BchC [Fonsecaea pedrosoi CBS 271.37]KIW79771.1 chlorophyll synthesis pathway protein BchC [Fonsecaea pedrosoi CBS 271.37]
MSYGHRHQAMVLYGAQDLRLETVDTPAPGANEVQIRPRATGICGTDIHYYEHGRNGNYVVRNPLVLGHEAAGEVVAVGKDVTSIAVGDRVAIEPQRPCGGCKQCKGGIYNLCPNLRFTGSATADPPVQGSLQQVYNHPASFVHRLPESLTFTEGALIEPLSVAMHAGRRAGLEAGQSVLIMGAGAIGLLCASVARLSGASRVCMVDVDQSRLDYAKSHKLADHVELMPRGQWQDLSKAEIFARTAQHLLAQPGFRLADRVFECTGVETCVNVGIHCTAPGGKVVLVGMGSPLQSIDVGAAAKREVDLLGLWRYANTFETAIELLASGRLDVKSLATHRFDLHEAAKAFDLVLQKPQGLIKCVISSD